MVEKEKSSAEQSLEFLKNYIKECTLQNHLLEDH